MLKISGFTEDTPKKFLLDAGVFVKNYDVGTDTFETAKADGRIIGATSGGGSFEIRPNTKKVEIDGASGDVKGLTRIDDWVGTISANVKEVTPESIALALGAATIADGPVGFKKITLKSEIEDSDYLTNVTWLGSISGETGLVAIQFKNALSKKGFSITVEDNDEAVIPMTFTAHAEFDSATNTWDLPVEIYYPDETVVA